MDFEALRAPIPRDKVHWRAQNLTKQGDKALALAYIDARDLMERLDDACGPENWEDSFVETAKGRLICTIKLFCDGKWVSKSDGAGATDIEGDKGGISDAFKRAGVKWGVGRELYDIGDVWVPCETKEWDGKKRWKKWTDDPWKYVKGQKSPDPKPQQQANTKPQPNIYALNMSDHSARTFTKAVCELLRGKGQMEGAKVLAQNDHAISRLSDEMQDEITHAAQLEGVEVKARKVNA